MNRIRSRKTSAAIVLVAIVVGAAGSLGAQARQAPRALRLFDHPGYRTTSNFVLIGPKWPTGALTYGFTNRTPDLPAAQVDSIIASAFAAWANVTNLSFTQVPDCGTPIGDPACQTPQFRLLFGAGNHGDSDPFDGPDGALAHASSPGPDEGGDTHFDEAEVWTPNDLFVVALHEFGHALGLDHTTPGQCPGPTGRNALMCPFLVDQTGLEPDDIAGIQSLYGVKTGGANSLSVAITGKGLVSSTPAGISCPTLCSTAFANGQSVTLGAEKTGRKWRFKGWGGACAASGTAGTCTLIASGSQSVTATFKKRRR